MSETNIEIRGLVELTELFRRENKELNKRGKRFLFDMGNFTKKSAKRHITEAGAIDLGELHDGINFKTTARRGSITTVVKPSDEADKYAIFVEDGTRPHRAPIEALRPWADHHGVPVGAVWHKIAEEGTEPRFFWSDTIADVKPEFNKRLKPFIASILED